MAKRLYKSQNRVFFGVCGGFADYLNIDPTIVRLVLIIATIAGFGAGVLIYIVAALIIPERPFRYDDEPMRSANENEYEDSSGEEFDKYFRKDSKNKNN